MKTVYDFTVKDRQGNDVSLSEYQGKVLLIVNTATGCGFTPHYEPLEAMYRELKEKGFEILDACIQCPLTLFGQGNLILPSVVVINLSCDQTLFFKFSD